jgi:deoxyadenosine/deoxycytidine kinase
VARGKYIAIAGNSGAGKTELTEFLCRRYGLEPFYEPNDANPYLADFYADMRAWGLQSQLFFLAHKFRLHQQLQDQDKAVIQDRTIYEDAEIFARNLHLQRLISKRDFETYWTLYEGLRHLLMDLERGRGELKISPIRTEGVKT